MGGLEMVLIWAQGVDVHGNQGWTELGTTLLVTAAVVALGGLVTLVVLWIRARRRARGKG